MALTLRAVGGLTTRQIAQAYLVPETTMAQRISRAKRTVAGVRFDRPGDLTTVLRVLYLVFNEGYSGDVDLAAEAIRLTRRLAAMTEDEEVAGLLALMLLHHARRPARTRPDGTLVALREQDRGSWDTTMIAEGVGVLQAALARDRLDPPSRGTPRSGRTSTSATATWRGWPGSTPRRLCWGPVSPSASTSPARPRGSAPASGPGPPPAGYPRRWPAPTLATFGEPAVPLSADAPSTGCTAGSTRCGRPGSRRPQRATATPRSPGPPQARP